MNEWNEIKNRTTKSQLKNFFIRFSEQQNIWRIFHFSMLHFDSFTNSELRETMRRMHRFLHRYYASVDKRYAFKAWDLFQNHWRILLVLIDVSTNNASCFLFVCWFYFFLFFFFWETKICFCGSNWKNKKTVFILHKLNVWELDCNQLTK